MAVDVLKKQIGRLTRQIERTNQTQAERKAQLAKLKAKTKGK